MVENGTDAQPVCLLLWDDSLLRFLLIVTHCTARKPQLAYVRYLFVHHARLMNYTAVALPSRQRTNQVEPCPALAAGCRSNRQQGK